MQLYPLFRKALFSQDAEWSHDFTLRQLQRCNSGPLHKLIYQRLPVKPVNVLGLTFPNPVGLAAGLDKDGKCIKALAALGFGFIEIGTVTPKPQLGNEKPRMFRLPEHKALINRMGFNNEGVDALVERVSAAGFKGILGINIGKNKDTPDAQGVQDYLYCLEKVYPHASYVTVNISSPNTPGLREFQQGTHLSELLSALKSKQKELTDVHLRYVPILVKIAPDMTEEQVRGFAHAIVEHELDGVIATNTTLDRSAVDDDPVANEAGGLSGEPLADKSTETIKWLRAALPEEIPIIGAGGIGSSEQAHAKLNAGAQLIQIYTGFIYQGPALIKSIVNSL
ncbi:dihydroorotate dehydrogenase (quinone) [Aliidiomarina iranensis]|uniref:Dihydroorotate dehydrogenase (quinone) n=1 Tax=Aliidiomarina iranensis TaxID=1434071 RepID=A0A432W090_9GAMM|nr:quinone-dependent dihydroorotate dehydrogenase [Aliidiomarina iranensis]RUO22398.1 dihydroorotate dehydrogenase (quinone) [Aliidiomarina iranensis]